MIEIERKFLVTSTAFIAMAQTNTRIVQGYLNSHPERAVRVRIKGDKGFLTIKGKGNAFGTSRFEWEKEIPVTEAEQLLALCEKGAIDKTRYEVQVDAHLFEVDIFEGENQGLILAEVELQDENETFTKPDWLGEEVTGDSRYYNSQLSKNPYANW
ncbi:CYTH domain-containing protein [Aquimarina rhabdastrellae]